MEDKKEWYKGRTMKARMMLNPVRASILGAALLNEIPHNRSIQQAVSFNLFVFYQIIGINSLGKIIYEYENFVYLKVF